MILETSKLKEKKKNFFLLLFVLHASNSILIALQVIKDMLKVNILFVNFLNLFAQLFAKAKCKTKDADQTQWMNVNYR